MHVLGIEHFANKIGQPGKAGDTVGLLLDADQSEIQRGDVLVAARTTEGATQIGAQRASPSSPAKIQAEVKQTQRALDPAGEQRDDGQVEAAERPSE